MNCFILFLTWNIYRTIIIDNAYPKEKAAPVKQKKRGSDNTL